MYRIDTIDFFQIDKHGKTSNHLVFSTVHSLEGFFNYGMFQKGNYVRIDITHADGEIYRFDLKNPAHFNNIKHMYKLADEAASYAREYKVNIKHPSDFKAWMLEQFEHNQLADICNSGVSGGFSGLIYTKEINDLYDRYHVSLWEMLDEMSDGNGFYTVLDLMAQFDGASRVDTNSNFKELVVWACAEEIANQQTQGEYKEESETDNDEDSNNE